MVDDLARWRAAETQGAARDQWVRDQFAGIVAGAAKPKVQPPRPGARRNPKRRKR